MKLRTQALVVGLILGIMLNLVIIFSAIFYGPGPSMIQMFTGNGMAGGIDLCIDWYINLSELPTQTARQDHNFSIDINLTERESIYYPLLNFTDNTTLFDINSTTGVIAWTPNVSHLGTHSINITIGNNACREPDDSMILNILVQEPNFAPVINMTNVTLTEDINFYFNVTNYTYDPDGDVLKYRDYYERLVNGVDVFVIGEYSGLIDFTPNDLDVGNHTIQICVKDPGELSSCQDVWFEILNINDIPNLTTIGAQTIEINVSKAIVLSAYDPDSNEALTFFSNTSWFLESSNKTNTSSSWATYILNITITNNSWINETFSINVTVNDTIGTQDSEVISLTVVHYNSPPNITYYNPLYGSLQRYISMYIGDCQSFNITKEDLDGTIPLTRWYYNNTDSGITTDYYTFCPPNAGIFNITVVVTDSILNDSESWIVTASVKPSPEPPSSTPSGTGGGGAGMFCEPAWRCNEWQTCQPGNIQTRACWDKNFCGKLTGKPDEAKGCIYTEFPTCFDMIENQNELLTDCGGVCKPCPECDDGIQNQGEEGIDCGGPCPVCKELLAPEEIKKLPVELKQIVSNLSIYWMFWLMLSILLLSMVRAVREVSIEKIKAAKGRLSAGSNTRKVNRLLALSYKEIKAKNHEKAKEHYTQAKEMYSRLSDNEKAKVNIKGL